MRKYRDEPCLWWILTSPWMSPSVTGIHRPVATPLSPWQISEFELQRSVWSPRGAICFTAGGEKTKKTHEEKEWMCCAAIYIYSMSSGHLQHVTRGTSGSLSLSVVRLRSRYLLCAMVVDQPSDLIHRPLLFQTANSCLCMFNVQTSTQLIKVVSILFPF